LYTQNEELVLGFWWLVAQINNCPSNLIKSHRSSRIFLRKGFLLTYKSPKYREPDASKVVGTVAELFAGVGGFRIGLARAGWKTVYSNQWEPSTKAQHASDCYVHNFGDEGHSNLNISEVKSIPKTDLLVGGFPCQDYSVAKSLNSSKGLQGKKGVLWWDIQRLVAANKPKYVFLENVDRLLKSPSSQRGRDFAIMLSTLGSLGYLIEWRVVNAADYGFPQRRIRVLIVATKTSKKSAFTQHEAEERIFSSGVLARALPVLKNETPLTVIDLSSTPEVLSKSFGKSEARSPFKNSGVFLAGTAYTVESKAVISDKKLTLGEVLEPEASIDPEFWIHASRLKDWQYLKGAKSINRVHKASGAVYKYAEGRMSFPDSIEKPSRTILTGEGGISPSRFKHVVKIGRRYRRLTPLELERLNGFPDHWTESTGNRKISENKRAFFMGNALVIGLVEKVGVVIARDLKESKKV
jgi:DNA (cytosine-5)-methyltransferase 1